MLAARASRPALLWTGRVLSALFVAFMLIDGAIKIVPLPAVTDTMAALGWPMEASVARGLGVVSLAATVLYAVPRTALLGAILLTGYLGGAMATQLRAGSPVFSHLLFGLYLGLTLWAGLWLRDPTLRALLPVRRA